MTTPLAWRCWNPPGWRRFARSCGLWLGLLAVSASARAEPLEQVPLGLARITERTTRDTPMHFEQKAYRSFILDRLRSLGIRAVGGEDDVFGRNGTRAPELLLGGVVREFECEPWGNRLNCRIGLQWQLLDVRTDRMLYETTVRVVEYGIQTRTPSASVGRELLAKGLQSLLQRPRFRSLLVRPQSAVSDMTFPKANIKRCAVGSIDMVHDASRAIDATVVVEGKAGAGSGVFLNDEGFVLTAAHLVGDSSALAIRLKDGRSFEVAVLRVSRNTDSALLQVRGNLKSSCLELADGEAKVGAELYAIAAPSRPELPFSLTRGIVSGLRKWDVGALLQTDATVTPGNSGGPLLGVDGRLKAIISWKVAGAAMEETASGVPIPTVLQALGLNLAASSAAELGEILLSPASLSGVTHLTDAPDAVPSLDPPGEQHRVRQTRASELQRALVETEGLPVWAGEPRPRTKPSRTVAPARVTPAYVTAMRWGGLALASVGLVTAVVTRASYDRSTSTRREYQSLRLWNDLGLAGVGVGAGTFGFSWVLPPLPRAGQGEAQLNRSLSSAFFSFEGGY